MCVHRIAKNIAIRPKWQAQKICGARTSVSPETPTTLFENTMPQATNPLATTVVPYQPPAPREDVDLTSSISSTLPMAAMLTRNRFVGWAAFVFGLQSWLGESAEAKSTQSTPGYFSVGMACKCFPLWLRIPPKQMCTFSKRIILVGVC